MFKTIDESIIAVSNHLKKMAEEDTRYLMSPKIITDEAKALSDLIKSAEQLKSNSALATNDCREALKRTIDGMELILERLESKDDFHVLSPMTEVTPEIKEYMKHWYALTREDLKYLREAIVHDDELITIPK